MAASNLRVGIDVGGSGIKGAVVDLEVGEMVSERRRIETPPSFAFDEVLAAICEVIADLDTDGTDDALGVGFPGVVAHGVVKSPPTAHEFEGWIGRDLGAAIADVAGRRTVVRNDADAAGLAEHRFGAGQGCDGVVLVFTLGTGVGSAMFVDGQLVPNTELGKLFTANQPDVAELQMAGRIRGEEDLTWEEWGGRLNTYFQHVDRLFTPDLIIVGGGISKKHEKFLQFIDVRARVVPAELRNSAGIVGAALSA